MNLITSKIIYSSFEQPKAHIIQALLNKSQELAQGLQVANYLTIILPSNHQQFQYSLVLKSIFQLFDRRGSTRRTIFNEKNCKKNCPYFSIQVKYKRHFYKLNKYYNTKEMNQQIKEIQIKNKENLSLSAIYQNDIVNSIKQKGQEVCDSNKAKQKHSLFMKASQRKEKQIGQLKQKTYQKKQERQQNPQQIKQDKKEIGTNQNQEKVQEQSQINFPFANSVRTYKSRIVKLWQNSDEFKLTLIVLFVLIIILSASLIYCRSKNKGEFSKLSKQKEKMQLNMTEVINNLTKSKEQIQFNFKECGIKMLHQQKFFQSEQKKREQKLIQKQNALYLKFFGYKLINL